MLRRVYTQFWPHLAFVGLLALACAVQINGMVPPDSSSPPGPGLNISLGSGLQGNGSAGSPLDITHGNSNGQVQAWNGTQYYTASFCGDPSKRYCYIEEFEGGANAPSTCGTSQSMTGARTSDATCNYGGGNFGAGHPGVLSMQTGTAATSGVRMFTQQSGGIYFGSGTGEICAEQLVMFTDISNATIEYLFRGGFLEPTSNADSVDAVEMNYDRARAVALVGGGGNFWIVETSSNSNRTEVVLDGSTQGGVATVAQTVTAGTWYTIKQCVNADGTSATFYVNGTLSATVTSNIPTGSTRTTNLGLQCFNNTGGTPANEPCNVDYFRATLPFGAPR